MKKLKTEELGRISLEEFKKQEKFPFVILLDNIRSLNNVGSAFRTGDAFNVESIVLTGITGKPPHREIQKTALGATESVTWLYEENVNDAVDKLKNDGYYIVAVEQTNESKMLHNFNHKPIDHKICFIFGNEVFGVSDEVLELCNETVEIPQFGTKHSLNVSVSMGIVIWDYYSKAIAQFTEG